MKISAVTAILFASSTSAFYIYEPFSGGKTSTWTSGTPANIAWHVTPQVDPKTCSGLSLELMNGPAENANSQMMIESNIPNTSSGMTWEKVAEVPSGNDYFLRLTCLGQGSQYYSSRFTINNPNGVVTTTTSGAESSKALSAAALAVSCAITYAISML